MAEKAIEYFIRVELRLHTGCISTSDDIPRDHRVPVPDRVCQVTGTEWAIDGGDVRKL